MTPSIVSVDADGIVVKPGDVPAPPTRWPDMASAARYVAVASHRDGLYMFDRSCADRRHGNRFEVMEFADLVEAAMRDLRGTNGWTLKATAGDHTIWGRPAIDPNTGEAYDSLFNVTRGEIPTRESGYYRLNSILRQKGIAFESLVPATGTAAEVRAVQAPDHGGRMAWHGLCRREGEWVPAENGLGEPMSYASPQAARAGAEAALAGPEPVTASFGR